MSRITLTLKNKLDIIENIEKKSLSVKSQQEKYKCCKSQIYNILKKKNEINDFYNIGKNYLILTLSEFIYG